MAHEELGGPNLTQTEARLKHDNACYGFTSFSGDEIIEIVSLCIVNGQQTALHIFAHIVHDSRRLLSRTNECVHPELALLSKSIYKSPCVIKKSVTSVPPGPRGDKSFLQQGTKQHPQRQLNKPILDFRRIKTC